jgi:hypothetical protein
VAKTPGESFLRGILKHILRGTLKIGDRLPAFDRMGRQRRMSVA